MRMNSKNNYQWILVLKEIEQIWCNGDIDAYMRKIAECNNVVIVLTNEYVHFFYK